MNRNANIKDAAVGALDEGFDERITRMYKEKSKLMKQLKRKGIKVDADKFYAAMRV